MVGLFQEARAVSMTFQNPPDTIQGSQTFTVDIQIPDGNEVPITKLEAIVEDQADGRDDKVGVKDVARAECVFGTTAGFTCPGDASLTTSGDRANAITEIKFVNAFAIEAGVPAYTLTADDFASQGPYDFTGTGYGYDDISPQAPQNSQGYGYGYDASFAQRANSPGANVYAYGYTGDDLFLRYEITVDGNQLTQDTHYLTFLAHTESSVVSTISSPFTAFDVQAGNTGTPGGGGGGGAGLPGFDTIDAGDVFSAEEGQVRKIVGNLPSGINHIGLVFAQDCTECTVTVTRSRGLPAGASPMASGFSPIYFLTIEVRDADGNLLEDVASSGWISFNVDQDELPGNSRPKQVLLLRDNQGWKRQATTLESTANADPLEYNGTLSGKSFFAVTADTQPPSITNVRPTGSTTAVTPEIAADWSDNRRIDTTSLELRVDGVRQSSRTGSLSVSQSGFTFVPGTSLDDGAHNVSVTIKDASGLSNSASWSFRISDVECPQPPRITQVKPASGATDVDPTTTVRVTIQKGTCPIVTSSITVNGTTVPSTLSGTSLTAELPSGLGGEEVSVSALVVDTGGNQAKRDWSFTTEQAEEEPPEDGGLGALGWTLIIILVLAVVGIGAYFYTQQEGGGGFGG